jgi:hypothetical protein
MSETAAPGFLTRLFVLSWVAFFRTLFDAEFAGGIVRLREGQPALPPPPPEPKEAKKAEPKKKEAKKEVVLREAGPEAALQLLALLQREGRFVDFVQEDMSSFSDAEIGGAARVVHDGCKKALDEHFPITPVRSESEGASITLEKGFDAKRVRLTGNVAGDPPYRGALAHRGWRVTEVKLPKMAEGHDPMIVAPAEVEL